MKFSINDINLKEAKELFGLGLPIGKEVTLEIVVKLTDVSYNEEEMAKAEKESKSKENKCCYVPTARVCGNIVELSVDDEEMEVEPTKGKVSKDMPMESED